MKRSILILCILLFFLIAGIIICCNKRIEETARNKTYNNTEEIPYCKTALLLGTSPKLKNGRDNQYFTNRIQAAAQLYKAGRIKYIIVSGDNRKQDYNEPEEMRQALIGQSVPDSIIYLDYAGFRTLDSVVRTKEIFGQDSITIISQQFHNERAIFLAEEYAIHAIGFNARNVPKYQGIKTEIREYLARVKVFIDMALNKQPHFLGEKIKIE
ncbi:MAG: ElyC/SanA/YdcF family protein [Bacteroidales bacterium]|nr:ElyC/SanA/YdcF family protein [Bacteroidales bacterium]